MGSGKELQQYVFITKWALTKGIIYKKISIDPESGRGFDGWDGFKQDRDYSWTEENAQAKAQEMKTKRIAALKAQISQLEKIQEFKIKDA